MTGIATVICLALAAITALTTGLHALRNRGTNRVDLIEAGLTELAVLFYVGVRVVDLIGGHRPSSPAIVVVYLVAVALTLPIAAALAWAEPSRWGSIILVSGALIACVLFARVNQLWTPHG